jgi:hypothetical protein
MVHLAAWQPSRLQGIVHQYMLVVLNVHGETVRESHPIEDSVAS